MTLIIQLKLLNCGLITEADEIEKRMMSLISKYGSMDNLPEDVDFSFKYYEDLIAKHRRDGDIFPTKNSELLFNETLNNVFKEIKSRKACMHCKSPMFNRIQCLKNRIMIVNNHVTTKGRFVYFIWNLHIFNFT